MNKWAAHFYQRRQMNDQQVLENMHNITNQQVNANQNYSEVSPYTRQSGYYPKYKTLQMLARMCLKGTL